MANKRIILFKNLTISIVLVCMLLLVSCDAYTNKDFFSKQFPAINKQHERVLPEFYNENLIGFENKDETDTLYLFSSPVYINENNVLDICDNTITQVSTDSEFSQHYLYTNKFNNVKTYLPETIDTLNGIHIEYNNTVINVFSEKNKVKPNKVLYKNVYGKRSEYVCYEEGDNQYYITIEDFGIHTEFVLKNNKTTEIIYFISMENVNLDKSSPDYILFRETENNDVKAIIYYPIIIGKTENLLEAMSNKHNTVEITETENGIYKMTINLDQNYINNIKFPVKVSQTFHLYKAKQPHTSIYSNSNKSHYLNDTIVLGNGARGEGQLLVRFEALDLLNINPQNIISAEYVISEISGTKGEASIALYPVISNWCSINVRWNIKPLYSTENAYRATVSESGDYRFELAEILKQWVTNRGKEGDYTTRHGFVLINETSDVPKLFATCNSGIFTSCLIIKMQK